MPLDIQTPVTFAQLIIVVLFIFAVNFGPRFYDWLKLRAEMKAKELEAKERSQEAERLARERANQLEADKDDKVFERVVSQYEKEIKRGNKLESELEQLRPLAIENAVLKQKLTLSHEDKEDWKHHALGLEEQLKENNVIPKLFRRLPREGDTGEQLKTISRKMKTIKEENTINNGTEGSPTLIFPPVEGDGT